jgi:alpha-mannosidase
MNIFRYFFVLVCIAAVSANAQTVQPVQSAQIALPPVYIIPNFHPASCGWLTDWSTERNYCANSYLEHLNKVRDDGNYNFVLSECNNVIAIANFQPLRFEELKQRVKEGRVELSNAFFLESTINLSGGEALVKMGVEGLRWQQEVMGVRPRFCWAIDVCGTHSQMPQICSGLGLDALVYVRNNPFNKNLYWSEAPDGSRILTCASSTYSGWTDYQCSFLFQTKTRLTQENLVEAEQGMRKESVRTPEGAPVHILGGHGDYSLPPPYEGNPTEFLEQWKEFRPETEMHIATMSQFVDRAKEVIDDGRVKLPVLKGNTTFAWNAFWVNQRIKQMYRRNEHLLQSAEMAATFASLTSKYDYPSKSLYHSWLLMLLCMDRNTLWGAAGGMVFEHDKSWDVKDRLGWVEEHTSDIQEASLKAITGSEGKGVGKYIALFNPSSSRRSVPATLTLPDGSSLAGVRSEALPDGRTLCQLSLEAMSVQTLALKNKPAPQPQPIAMPETVETEYYIARVDKRTGALSSLKLKATGEELLGGNANVIIMETNDEGSPGDHLKARQERQAVVSSEEFPAEISVTEGELSITVTINSNFYGNAAMKRLIRFYKTSPRIDFETDIQDIPDKHVVVAEFPLKTSPTEIRKGIPYGFEHAAWSRPNEALHGSLARIQPTIRWSDYTLESGSGLALLDRGLAGREITDNKAIIFLMNATSKYYNLPNAWLSGAGRHHSEYAILPHTGWENAHIAQQAWEYNAPLVIAAHCAKHKPVSFVEMSDNVLIEAIRREGSDIEIRMVETTGKSGAACRLKVNIPHTAAYMTDMTGGNSQAIDALKPNEYTIELRPQQIVTLRLRTANAVEQPAALMKWDELVPENKRKALNTYLENVKGHPPRN